MLKKVVYLKCQPGLLVVAQLYPVIFALVSHLLQWLDSKDMVRKLFFLGLAYPAPTDETAPTSNTDLMAAMCSVCIGLYSAFRHLLSPLPALCIW